MCIRDRCGTSLYEAAEEGKIEEVKQLLADGADVNAKTDSFLETPLHFAAENGQKEVAIILIDKGADVNAVTDDGTTSIDAATHPNNPNKNKAEIADLLRKHGGKTAEELKAEGKWNNY